MIPAIMQRIAGSGSPEEIANSTFRLFVSSKAAFIPQEKGSMSWNLQSEQQALLV